MLLFVVLSDLYVTDGNTIDIDYYNISALFVGFHNQYIRIKCLQDLYIYIVEDRKSLKSCTMH